MQNRFKLVGKVLGGATALLGAIVASACVPPSASTASCCSGQHGEARTAMAPTEPAMAIPPTAQAGTTPPPLPPPSQPQTTLTADQKNDLAHKLAPVLSMVQGCLKKRPLAEQDAYNAKLAQLKAYGLPVGTAAPATPPLSTTLTPEQKADLQERLSPVIQLSPVVELPTGKETDACVRSLNESVEYQNGLSALKAFGFPPA